MGLYGNKHENTITWDVTSSLSGRNTRFGGKSYLHLQGRKQHFHNILPKALCVIRYEKNTHEHTIKTINWKFKKLFHITALLFRRWWSRFLQTLSHMQHTNGDTHQILIAFSTSNLTFKAIFNPKQKLNIKSQTNSFKTLPSSCVNDTDK
jgi:hypothetical protein